MEETLKKIALALRAIDAEDMSKAELKICNLLVEQGFMVKSKFLSGSEYFDIKEKA